MADGRDGRRRRCDTNDAAMSPPSSIWPLLLLLIKTVAAGDALERCSSSLDFPGVTRPAGDVVVAAGRPLQIDCLLDPRHDLSEGRNATDLFFVHGSTPVDANLTTVVDEYTLRLRIERPPDSLSMYYCKLRDAHGANRTVCLNTVTVGHAPRDVDDFSCVSMHWQNLTCTWSASPRANHLRTDYRLWFTLTARSGRGKLFPCPNVTRTQDNRFRCVWSHETSPIYRTSYEEYTFILSGTNILGEHNQTVPFDHYARVKPPRPHDFACAPAGPHTANLSWTVPYHVRSFPRPFDYRLIYVSSFHPVGAWQVTNVSAAAVITPVSNPKSKDPNRTLHLDGLEYANADYDVRLFMRSDRATDEDMWSDFAACVFRTASERPDRPPGLVSGMFELSGDRNVSVHWRQIEPHEENGPKFGYVLTRAVVDGEIKPLKPTTITKSHAQFEKFPDGEVTLFFASSNAVGKSQRESSVLVPSKANVLPEPAAFTKMATDDERTYELSWKPAKSRRVTGYTVFWCSNERERPLPCHGRMNWTSVGADATVLTVTVDTDAIYHFAIAANGDRASSGMVWAKCTAWPGKTVDKMRTVWVNSIGATHIELGWSLDCSERIGDVVGYHVVYCSIPSLHDTSCREPPRNVTLPGDASTNFGTVTGLTPYTLYMLSVAVVTKHGRGAPSDYRINHTLEGEPTKPMDVVVSHVCNDRMTVSWKPPLASNGKIRYYKVSFDPEREPVKVNVDESSSDVQSESAMLVDLKPFTNYTVVVMACIEVCSAASDPVNVRTAIGRPSQLDAPTLLSNVSRNIELTWASPRHPGGTVDHFEIRVVEKLSDNRELPQSFRTEDTHYTLPFLTCQTAEVNSYHYSVRAVNKDIGEDHGVYVFTGIGTVDPVDFHNAPKQYEGNWSRETPMFCKPDHGEGYIWLIVLGAVAVLALLAWCIVRVYKKCKIMADIKPKLPFDINTVMDRDRYMDGIGNPYKHGADESNLPPADIESLLSTKRPNPDLLSRIAGNERSDCSVNTDSTALSLNSNRGSSDEAKEPLDSQDSVRSDSFSPSSSIRLRDLGGSGSRPGSASSASEPWIGCKPEFIPDDDCLGIAAYTAVGVPDWPHDETPEVPKPLGYVTLDAVVKNSNAPRPMTKLPSGYVMNGISNGPTPSVIPVEASKGYVRADDLRMVARVPPMPARALPRNSFTPDYTDKSSDYVKRNDPDLVLKPSNGGLSLVMPTTTTMESVNSPQQAVVSPEAYCRIGPNTNVPHQFDFKQTVDDMDSDLSSIKDEHAMLFMEEPPPPRGEQTTLAPSSHYVPFKH